MKRYEAIARLKVLEDEFLAAEFAFSDALERATIDPGRLRLQNLSPGDLRRARHGVEATYTVRLFAEFEGFLRGYWATIRRTQPPMRKLIDGVVARRRSVPADLHAMVHAVRQYRNDLVHGGGDSASLAFASCRSPLCRFLAHLPEDW